MLREANKNDLDEILQLYLYLHEKSVPEDSQISIMKHNRAGRVMKMLRNGVRNL